MEIFTETKVVQYVKYDGIRFYRDGKGYWLGQTKGSDGRQHRIRLHTYVWEKHNGPVPDGYEIHHIDRNTDNNEIENLVMLTVEEHRALHASLLTDEKRQAYRENLDRTARPKAKEWHASEEGRKWHSIHGKEVAAKQAQRKTTNVCCYCGKEFEVLSSVANRTKFCSNKCKTASRYHSGVDNEVRSCSICGKDFICNKYSRIKTCSKNCANISESRVKTGAPRPRKKAP